MARDFGGGWENALGWGSWREQRRGVSRQAAGPLVRVSGPSVSGAQAFRASSRKLWRATVPDPW